MKLMFASDIHGSLPATERVLSLFAQSGAQWLIILGDVLNHGPRNALPEGYAPAQVAEKLNPYASRIIAVRGNCDSEVDQMLLHFPITAPWQQVLLEQHRLFLTHGHLFSPDNLPALAAGDVLAIHPDRACLRAQQADHGHDAVSRAGEIGIEIAHSAHLLRRGVLGFASNDSVKELPIAICS